jgi:hypothetical protein
LVQIWSLAGENAYEFGKMHTEFTKFTLLKADGCRRRGRPKLRWIDGLKDDLRMLSVRGWRQRMLARRKRKTVLEVAWAQTWL